MLEFSWILWLVRVNSSGGFDRRPGFVMLDYNSIVTVFHFNVSKFWVQGQGNNIRIISSRRSGFIYNQIGWDTTKLEINNIDVVSETQFKKINVQGHLLTLIPLYSYKQWNNEKRRARTSVFYFHRLTTTSTSARMIYVDLWGCGVHYTTTTGTMRILSCLLTIQVIVCAKQGGVQSNDYLFFLTTKGRNIAIQGKESITE
jgi:hypothetical protein